MTNEQIAILRADMRRHQRLAMACEEACMKENHEAIAEALAAAIEEKGVSGCSHRLVTKYDSSPAPSLVSRFAFRKRERSSRRHGK